MSTGRVFELAAAARRAWRELAVAETGIKNMALERIGARLIERQEAILSANAIDVEAARAAGRTEAFIDRLTLTEERIAGIVEGIGAVIALNDPVGQVLEERDMPSGLHIIKRRVPIGVIGIIYESRPNVTVDAAALCVKSGNAVVLRGGSDSINSNLALMEAVRAGLKDAGLDQDCAALVADTSREAVGEMLKLKDLIDLMMPRGGKGLIDFVTGNSSIPVVQTGDGVCHVYVDAECDIGMAVNIAVSAKVSRPSVCNSAETLLVAREIASEFLPRCLAELKERGVEVRGDDETRARADWVLPASEEDYYREYNDYIYNVKVVGGVNEAIDHINEHGTRHSEAIVTNNSDTGRYFQSRVDAAAVYVNVSTRFTDGYEFGLGAEIGISNQKLHARGPMGLNELTTYKYEVSGDGLVR